MPDNPIRLMIVDDDGGVLRALTTLFQRSGHQVIPVQDPTEALGAADEETPDVILCDIRMPKLSGMDLLAELKLRKPDAEVIMMTAFGDVRTAVEAVRRGAYDFLTKPFDDVSVVELAVQQAAEHRRLRVGYRALEQQLEVRDGFEDLVGGAPQMKAIYRMIETVAQSDATVLVEGESGTGKELVARAVHLRSNRKDAPFLAVNCSALPEGLIESELFGHVRGAFTGAVGAKKGLFEAAHRGTLFLDEIADLPPPAQVQLLRVLQEGEVRRVGSNEVTKVDVRVVAATNVDLKAARAKGKFREDLFYRINVIAIRLPPLRERIEDLPALASHFVARAAERAKKAVPQLTADALTALRRYRWPGNVRELENAMERAVLLAHDGKIGPAELPSQVGESTSRVAPEADVLSSLPYAQAKQSALHTFEKRYLGALMRKTEGNLSEAARLAGMDRSNFRRL
ncbi:MAG TPA: sigma-54 dependent transcriptional regulator, partial [Myxococcales bacterium]|nr:sigma-54 dependent transcriptional regulator [Myxococcales bacterium]